MNTDEIRALLHGSAQEITRLKEVEKQLLRERGELLADRRRLDWLEQTHGGVVCLCKKEGDGVVWSADFHAQDWSERESPRSAIDAAMKT